MLKDGAQRKIIHIDMDCFYAAVEMKHNPRLCGKAIGVGGPPNTRSVLCTASYEARKFGVRSAMSSNLAVKLCPHLILVPPNFTLYKEESRVIHEIFRKYTDSVEPLSLDEAYLDVSQSQKFGGSATLIAEAIRAEIFKATGLKASAGVAPNKFLAKIASDWRKPNGIFIIPPKIVAAFVKELPLARIPGVGKVSEQRMRERGFLHCSDLAAAGLDKLIEVFGSRGRELWNFSQGHDPRPVISHWERKSLTVEETFNRDIECIDECLFKVLPDLYQDWERRMQKSNYRERIRGFVVKAKYFDFQSMTHERAMAAYPSLQNFQDLFREIWRRRSDPLRLIGLGVRLETSKVDQLPCQLSFSFS